MPAERFVPRAHSRAILPAALGVPALAAVAQQQLYYYYYYNYNNGLGAAAVWQGVAPCSAVASAVVVAVVGGVMAARDGAAGLRLEDYLGLDVGPLMRAYEVVMVGAGLGHVRGLVGLVSGAGGVAAAGWCEVLLIPAAVLVLCLTVVCELSRVGMVGSSVKRAWAIPLGCVVVGPGATLMATWRFMEDTMRV